MDRLDKVLGFVHKTLAVLAGLLLLFVILSISVSITLRTLNLHVPLWSVQFNEYSLLWMTFLGGAWLLRKKGHVSLDIVTRRLSVRSSNRLQAFHAVLGLVVCGILTWSCASVTWNNFQRGVMDVRAVDVPMFLILSVVCIGFLLMSLEFLRDLLLEIRRLREAG